MVPERPPGEADATVVRWEGEATPRLRTAFRHVVAGVFAAVGLLVALGLLLFAYQSLVGGVTEAFLLLLVLVLVGGPFSLLYLVAVRRQLSVAELFPRRPDLNPWYVLCAVPVGVVLVYGWLRFPPVAVGYILGAPLLWAILAARESSGELDVAAGTLTVEDVTAPDRRGPTDVRTLRSHSSLRVGRYRLLRLRYAGTAALSRPSFLVVPDADYPRVDAGLSAVESRDYGAEVRRTSTAAKAFLAGFGLLFVAITAGLVLAVDERNAALPALTIAAFGLGFVLLAWFS